MNGKYVVVAVEVPIACVDDLLVELFVILEVSFRFSVVLDDMVVTLVTSIKFKISFCHLKTMQYLLLHCTIMTNISVCLYLHRLAENV